MGMYMEGEDICVFILSKATFWMSVEARKVE